MGLYEQGAKLGHQKWVQRGLVLKCIHWILIDGSKHVANEELRTIQERGCGGNPKMSRKYLKILRFI